MLLDPTFVRAVKAGTVKDGDFHRFIAAAENGDTATITHLIQNHGGHYPSSAAHAAALSGHYQTFIVFTRAKPWFKVSDYDWIRKLGLRFTGKL